MSKFLFSLVVLVFSASLAHAQLSGTYRTEEGETGGYAIVEFHPCSGDAGLTCGTIRDLVGSDNESIIGRLIVDSMEDRGDGAYRNGRIWAPDQDRWYSARMTDNGSTLRVSGCVAGGIICRSQTWAKM